MKNSLVMLLAVLLLSGCQNDSAPAEEETGNTTADSGRTEEAASVQDEEPEEDIIPVLHVATTFFVPYDLAKGAGGDYAEVQMLVKPGEDPSVHEVTEEDKNVLEMCDVFIYSGGITDAWAEEALEMLDESTAVYSLQEGMDKLIEDGVMPDLYGTQKAEGQEIYWAAPVNAMLLCSDISVLFAERDPDHAQIYDQNFSTYLKRLSEADQEIADFWEQSSEDEFIFAGQSSYLNFAEEYQLHYHAAAEESAAGQLAEQISSEDITAFFYDELSDTALVESVSSKTDAEPILLRSGAVISEKEIQGGITLAELLLNNIESMKDAFK